MKYAAFFFLLPFLLFSQNENLIVSGTALIYQGGAWVDMPVENILAMAQHGSTSELTFRPINKIIDEPGALYVGETNINDPASGIEYITVTINGILRPFIDYGSGDRARDKRNREVKDGEGREPGPSVMEVFNFLARCGWEFIVLIAPDTYLFKRKG